MSIPSEAYPRRVEAIIRLAEPYISESAVREARDFAKHSEGPDALYTVAWAIIESGAKVPAALVEEIRYFSEDYTYPEGFPQGLDEHVEAEA